MSCRVELLSHFTFVLLPASVLPHLTTYPSLASQDASAELRQKLFDARFGAMKAEAAASLIKEEQVIKDSFIALLKETGVTTQSR